MRVIYDFGANNGDDVPYYLLKGDRVVAVEANPVLAEGLEKRFAAEIRDGRLVVIAKVLSKLGAQERVPFYVHTKNHVLSQFPRPSEETIGDFKEIFLPSQSPSEIIRAHGHPHYVKVDIEHYDHFVLEEMFAAGIRPDFLSAESHDIRVFAALVAVGGYRAFKLVDGRSVAEDYRDHRIQTSAGEARYSFPHHSAGPFGHDVKGPWMTAENLFYLLAQEELGWKDIHATNEVEPDPSFRWKARVTLGEALRILPGAAMRTVRRRLPKRGKRGKG